MQEKSSPTEYRSQKPDITKKNVFENSPGSFLLFEARRGALRTMTFGAKFQEADKLCAACRNESETLEYFVLKCTGFRPALPEGITDFAEALSFASDDGRTEEQRNTVTKRRLEDWWKLYREN